MADATLFALGLPAYAEPQDSYQTTQTFQANFVPWGFRYNTDGTYIDVMLSITFTVVTGATTGDRLGQVVWGDGNGQEAYAVAAAEPQPESTVWDYSFMTDLSTAYVASTTTTIVPQTRAVAGMPLVQALPTWFVVAGLLGGVAGDQASDFVLTYLRIPTGEVGPDDEPATTPIASPVLG